jgi:hypothetical protein
MPGAGQSRAASNRISGHLTRGARSIERGFAGHVSKTALVSALLPLSFASLFGTLISAAWFYPSDYDWRVCVISNLSSPRHNPQGCWLAATGTMAAMLLALPFAGYVARRLRTITPRLAGPTGLTFAAGFGLLWLAAAAQIAEPAIGLPWMHQVLAGAAGGMFILGMLGCCACALKDRLRCFHGQRSLPAALARYWVSLTLLPIGTLAGIGALMVLGHQAGQTWAEDFRQSFRQTVLWQLAFWEWVGAVAAYAFLAGSALLLPVPCGDREAQSGRASTAAEAGMESLLPEDRRAF